jgi:hypothetical protein
MVLTHLDFLRNVSMVCQVSNWLLAVLAFLGGVMVFNSSPRVRMAFTEIVILFLIFVCCSTGWLLVSALSLSLRYFLNP